MNNEKVILRELDFLKLIGVLLVVIGHCTSIYTGGWVFTSPVNSPIYGLIASYVYTFHVPMLVFVSGSIYYYCRINKGKYNGVEEDKVVINGKGLIGRVIRTTTFTSDVRLITTSDTNNKISVSVSHGGNYIYGLIK